MNNRSNADESGTSLLHLFANFDVDLKKLKPNIIRSWFYNDSINKDTQKLLNWLAESYLTESNYLSSLYRYEFQKIDQPLNLEKCNEELVKLNPGYAEVFQPNHDALSHLRNDIALLEKEEHSLSEMIELSKSVNHQLSLEYSANCKTEIQSKVETETRQSECEKLAKVLDEVHEKLSLINFKEHDENVYLVNVTDPEIFRFNCDFNLNLSSSTNLEDTLSDLQEDNSSQILELYQNRVFHSCQLYLKNEILIEVLRKKLDCLSKFSVNQNLNESMSLSCVNFRIPSKDVLKRNVDETVDKTAKALADQCLEETLLQYNKRELEVHCLKFARKKNTLNFLTKIFSYYALTLCIQVIRTQNIERLSKSYQNLMEYVEKNLLSCRTRTENMKKIIDEREKSLARPEMEKYKFVATLGKILNLENCTLKSVAEAVQQLKNDLDIIQNDVICSSLLRKCPQLDENISVLTEFLRSGPTNKIVLVPVEVQNVCYLLDTELKMAHDKVRDLTKELKTKKKTSNIFNKYSRLLWMNFLTNPSKVEEIIKQAEDDFNEKNKHYF